MFEIPHNQLIPMERFTEYLTTKTEVYVDREMFLPEIEVVEAKYKSRFDQLRLMMYSTLGFIPAELNTYILRKYFDKLGYYERYFMTQSETASFRKERMLQMIADNVCIDFGTMYVELTSLKYYLAKLKKLEQHISYNSTVEGNENETLTVVPYIAKATHNRRFSTANENIIGFYGSLKSALKARKGYVLLSGDFPQIDGKGALYLYFKNELTCDLARNSQDTYLVFKEFQRHVYHLKDKYKLEQKLKAEEYSDTTDLEKRISEFNPSILPFESKSQRDIYKVISLSTVYNKRSHYLRPIAKATQDLAEAMEATGRYRIIREMVEYLRNIGYPITTISRWGHTRPIVESSPFRTLSKVLNSSIQTTSSEILIVFITYILDYFYEKGVSRDDIRIYLNRHDEPILEIKEELFVEHAQFFKNVSHILIHGWLPFEIEWKVGYSYSEPIPYYTQLLESLPYDNSIINKRAEEFLNINERMPLDIPDICALSYRFTPNGLVLFVLTRYIGEFPSEEYYFDKYRDTRKIEYHILRVKTQSDKITFDDLMLMIQKFLDGLPKTINYVVTLNNGSFVKTYSINGYSVFVTGASHPLHGVNKVILSSYFTKNYPEIATDEDRQYSKYTDYYSKRIVRRVK